MASILEISQDAQNVVRLSTLGLETMHDLELDIITYTVFDKDGNSTGLSYEGRNFQEDAHTKAGELDLEFPQNGPHYVEAKSNLSINESGKLSFELGSKSGIKFPTEEINIAADSLKNAIDCDAIQAQIDSEIKKMKDIISAKTADMDLLGGKSDLMKLPSNPLKILSWAKKFVSKSIAPQLLAMVDLAQQLSSFAGALQNITQAASAAQQNLLLCAASVTDNTIDTVIDEATTALEETFPKIDQALTKINEIQGEIVDITGTEPIFNTTSIEQLIESATAPAKARFQATIDNFVAAPFEDVSLAAETVNQLSSSFSGSSSFATSTLASAGALAAVTSFEVGGTTFTFENGVLKTAV